MVSNWQPARIQDFGPTGTNNWILTLMWISLKKDLKPDENIASWHLDFSLSREPSHAMSDFWSIVINGCYFKLLSLWWCFCHNEKLIQVSCKEQKILIWRPIFPFFQWVILLVLYVIVNRTMSQTFSFMFSSIIFIVLARTFRSMIHFELIFVDGVR